MFWEALLPEVYQCIFPVMFLNKYKLKGHWSRAILGNALSRIHEIWSGSEKIYIWCKSYLIRIFSCSKNGYIHLYIYKLPSMKKIFDQTSIMKYLTFFLISNLTWLNESIFNETQHDTADGRRVRFARGGESKNGLVPISRRRTQVRTGVAIYKVYRLHI